MILIYILIFIFGLVIGSFINCLVYRLHKQDTLWGRSYCPHCSGKIAWYDNIPVLSWIFLRAKCRKCQKSIALQYPLVELATGILFALALYSNLQVPISTQLSNFQFPISSWFFLARDLTAIGFLIVIFIYDLRYYLILDKISLPAIVIIFLLNIIAGLDWLNLLISGIIGGSFFLLQFVLSRGKWIGGGDIRLGALMGVLLGWPQILAALFLSYILGSLAALPLLLSGRKKMSSQLPLGAFLVPGTIITLFWGQPLIGWYLGFLF